MTYVADVLEVSRDFLLTSLEYGSPPFVQPLDAPLDEARLEEFLESVDPMPRPPAADGEPNMVVFLPQSVVDEASALAAREGTSLSAVVSQRFTQGFPGLREGLRTEDAELARKVAGPAKDERVKCQLHLPTSVQEQLRELAELADRTMSWLLAAAFRLSGS